MPLKLPALPRRNAPWTPFQRRTWLAERRHHHRLLPAPVLRPEYPDKLAWNWSLPNPYKWNVWMSLDGGTSWMLVDDYWTYGDGRRFAPDGGFELYYIVGVDASGNEITEHSNLARPDDAPVPQMFMGFDGRTDEEGYLFGLPGSLVQGFPNGDPPAYVTDWTDEDSLLTPHCMVSNRAGAFYQSNPFPTPSGGSKGTVAMKILLPAGGSYHGLTPFWGDWGIQMLYLGSACVTGGDGALLYIQSPVGTYLSTTLMFPNDGRFHWIVFRWDFANGLCELMLDGLTETVTLSDYSGVTYDWAETMVFQSNPPWELDTYLNVISRVSWWDQPISDYELTELVMI